jgi:hypothetical protein
VRFLALAPIGASGMYVLFSHKESINIYLGILLLCDCINYFVNYEGQGIHINIQIIASLTGVCLKSISELSLELVLQFQTGMNIANLSPSLMSSLA